MGIHGITIDYIQGLQLSGFSFTPKQLISLIIHQRDPNYINEIKVYFQEITMDQLIATCVHHITPEFIEMLKEKGFTELTIDQVIKLKIANVF